MRVFIYLPLQSPLLSLFFGDLYQEATNASNTLETANSIECVWNVVATRFGPFFCSERVLSPFASPWVSTVSQLEIEKDYWNHIGTLITTPAAIWLSGMPRDAIKQNSINWDSTKTSLDIEQRRTMIKNQLQTAQHRLHNHQQPPHLSYLQMGSVIPLDEAMNIILSALFHLVRDNLQYLRMNFEHKRILLGLDMKDAHLVKSFYDMNPTEHQVSKLNSTRFSTLILFHFSFV